MTINARYIGISALAGLVAGMVMAMYAMLASATFLNQGLFTPLYGIASPVIGESEMMHSMKEGVYFSLGPALLGLMIHLVWSALFGIIFGLLLRALRLSGVTALLGGLGFGIVIMVFMAGVVLPLVGVGGMSGMIGWPSFAAEHLLFGGVLGLWPLLRPQDVTTSSRLSLHQGQPGA